MIFALSILVAYLAGSIPSAVWVGKLGRGVDVRQHGSGNMGAANVARVLGLKWAIVVGLLDIFKGFASVLWLGPLASADIGLPLAPVRLILGATAILGHLFPVFANFKGGKGVLTAAGVFLALLPLDVGIALIVWFVVFLSTRIVSLGSILAALALAISVTVRRFALDVAIPDSLVAATAFLVLLVLVTHRANIGRLLRGEESRFKGKRARNATPPAE